MKLITQTPARPERILGALEELIEADTNEVRLGVAYITSAGLDLLLDRLRTKLGSKKWDKAKKRVITCVDYGITEPAALSRMIALPNALVRIHNAHLISHNQLSPSIAFHSKFYDLRTTAHANVLVGSANLTERALTANTEAATLERRITKLAPLNSAWVALSNGGTPVDPALIAAYRAVRATQPPVPKDPPTPAPSAAPGLSLGEAIEAGTCNPADWEFFWVDAGNLSGGSKNQLELPRGANRYFGFTFQDYHLAQQTIGSVGIVLGPGSPELRQVSWHGDNRMERVYLPTGIDYSGQVVLFRRLRKRFGLDWAPSGSERANSWARASETVNQRFKVGAKSARTCGLF